MILYYTLTALFLEVILMTFWHNKNGICNVLSRTNSFWKCQKIFFAVTIPMDFTWLYNWNFLSNKWSSEYEFLIITSRIAVSLLRITLARCNEVWVEIKSNTCLFIQSLSDCLITYIHITIYNFGWAWVHHYNVSIVKWYWNVPIRVV